MLRPPRERSSASIFVKGQGPAIQEALAFRNSFPSPASMVTEPIAAFHFPSGEHGGLPSHGTLPVFITSNVLTELPTFTDVVVFVEYLARTLVIITSGCLGCVWVLRGIGIMRAM